MKESVTEALEASKAAVTGDVVSSGIVALLDEVESIIGRALEPDELRSVGRALRAGVPAERVAGMIAERPPEVPDEEVAVRSALLTSPKGGGQFEELS